MARIVIDLDDALVADASKILGTSTTKDTINAALREVLENQREALALMRPHVSATEGAFLPA